MDRDPRPLRGKVAVVAGATRGAGRGIAVRTDHTVPEEVARLFERVNAWLAFEVPALGVG